MRQFFFWIVALNKLFVVQKRNGRNWWIIFFLRAFEFLWTNKIDYTQSKEQEKEQRFLHVL